MPVSGTFATRVLNIGTTRVMGQTQPRRPDFEKPLARQLTASLPMRSRNSTNIWSVRVTQSAAVRQKARRDCQKFCVRDFCEGGFELVVAIEYEI
jgi:hypothetical protein